MSGDEVQVDPKDLTGKASQIRGLTWSSVTAQPALISPDALVLSSVAITNLSVNAESMWAYQEYGKVEGQRLAQTLDNVAAAYAEVDRTSGENVGATMGVPGGPPGGGSVMPKAVDIPPLPHPPEMPIPKGIAAPDPMWDPVETQQALDAGDDAASLRAAAEMWRGNATSLEASAQQFETKSLSWEGQAADAAYSKFNAYRDWLVGLAGSWERLAAEAEHLASAHDSAKKDHQPIADEYQKLYSETMGKPLDASVLAKMERMAELQGQSEELRNTYARDGQPDQIQPEDPPSPVVGGMPVTAEDHRRARQPRPGEGDGNQPGSGAGSGSGGQQQPGGEPPMPQEAPVSPMSAGEPAQQAAQQAAQQGSQGGSQGGSKGGGSPGGGSQGGGAPGGGMPGAGKSEPHLPKLPTDPSLKPAAAGGGSGGGSGGGGGGGIPGSPLQPAVGAETVAPSPVVGPTVPVAAAGGAAGSGGMGGGMGGGGGMAPMGHGAQGGSGDKKRNPLLTEDVPLYVEDRPHTEQVIGVRPRRRGAPDDAKKGDTQ